MARHYPPEISRFLAGKPEHTLALLDHFLTAFEQLGELELGATKTMIGISHGGRRIAWITQLGQKFIHVVFPFKRPYKDNLCFQKVAQVPGSEQYNHHFRMLLKDDLNAEVLGFMKLSLKKGT